MYGKTKGTIYEQNSEMTVSISLLQKVYAEKDMWDKNGHMGREQIVKT